VVKPAGGRDTSQGPMPFCSRTPFLSEGGGGSTWDGTSVVVMVVSQG